MFINRVYRRSDGIPPFLLQLNPLILTENDVVKARVSSEDSSSVFFTSNGKWPTINDDSEDLSIDPLVIEKETVLRLLYHLKPVKASNPDGLDPMIMKTPADVIVEPLTILPDMSLR